MDTVYTSEPNLDCRTGFPSKGSKILRERWKTKMRQKLFRKNAKLIYYTKPAACWVFYTFSLSLWGMHQTEGMRTRKPNLSSSVHWSEPIFSFGFQWSNRLKLWEKNTLMFLTWLPSYIHTALQRVEPSLKSPPSQISASVPTLKRTSLYVKQRFIGSARHTILKKVQTSFIISPVIYLL